MSNRQQIVAYLKNGDDPSTEMLSRLCNAFSGEEIDLIINNVERDIDVPENMDTPAMFLCDPDGVAIKDHHGLMEVREMRLWAGLEVEDEYIPYGESEHV